MAVDAAYNSFAVLKEGWDKCRSGLHSEQDVRFNVIDRMLTEVLGWAHSDIKTEPHVESGYVDLECARELESYFPRISTGRSAGFMFTRASSNSFGGT